MNIIKGKEIEVITGLKQAKKQAQWFDDNGIRFVIDANGKIVTTSDWLNGWDKYQPVTNDGFDMDFLNAS